MSTLISLALLGAVVWFCRTETPAVARHHEVGEDETTGRGHGDEY